MGYSWTEKPVVEADDSAAGMRAVYLAYRALMLADPRTPFECNLVQAEWLIEEPLRLRLAAAGVLASRQRPDVRVARAVELLNAGVDDRVASTAGR